MTFNIRRLESFDLLFTRLVRRAKRLGLTVPTYTVVNQRQETATIFEISEGECRDTGKTEQVVVHEIDISGLDPIRLNGWEFAASLEHLPTGTLVFPVPGIEIPLAISQGCRCDHCNLSRQRVKTYVVRHVESGEFKQIGSNCLRDFLGADSPEHLAELFKFYGSITHDLDALSESERCGWQGGGVRAYDLLRIVTLAVVFSGQYGWLSSTKARENGGGTPTAERVREHLRPAQTRALDIAKQELEEAITEKHRETAEEAIAYFAALSVERRRESTLNNNASVIANAGFCSDKSLGLAAALPVCHQMAMTREAREARHQRQIETSAWVGTTGVRGVFTATVCHVANFDTDYGPQTRTIMEDDQGNVLVCNALMTPGEEFNEQVQQGDRVKFKATVKEHTEYEQVKQTKLLRPSKAELLGSGC